MNVKVYIYPRYIDLQTGMGKHTPLIEQVLSERGVTKELVEWSAGPFPVAYDGAEPVMVRVPLNNVSCRFGHLLRQCEDSGHLVFYEDTIFSEEGVFAGPALKRKVNEFLDRLVAYHSGG